MEKKKVNKLVNNEEHTKLIKLFAEHSPEERSRLLNDIDNKKSPLLQDYISADKEARLYAQKLCGI